MRFDVPWIRTAGLAALIGLASTACERMPDTTAPRLAPRLAVSPSAPARYVVIAAAQGVPAGLANRVAAAGGVVVNTVPQIGMIVATSADPAFSTRAAALPGVAYVVPDAVIQWIDPHPQVVGVPMAQYANPPNSGDDDFFFDLEWGMTAVGVPAAWNGGLRGAGARVAILDSGIDPTHPDLAPNLNTTLSASFVPGEGYAVHPGSYFNHGSHVAGIVAGADNAFGIIGVAPEAELVAVKVLSEYTGNGAFSWVASGIVYAADIDADVINMSLGGSVPRHGFIDADGTRITGADVAGLYLLINRAAQYAYQHGTTIIASAGNSAIDRDHDADLLVLPADLPNVLAISATAPEDWAADPTTDLDVPAFYTNYGQSAIDFAAPGGDFDNPDASPCTVAGLTRPCWVFDMVFSASPGGWYWAAGTSQAAPFVSGIAALIIGAHGGPMPPAQVEAALRSSADDLGKPGKDDYFGLGRVSAANLVQ